jgi:hypothetical protein
VSGELVNRDLKGRLPSKSHDRRLGQFPKVFRMAQTATVTLTRMVTKKVGSFSFTGNEKKWTR